MLRNVAIHLDVQLHKAQSAKFNWWIAAPQMAPQPIYKYGSTRVDIYFFLLSSVCVCVSQKAGR